MLLELFHNGGWHAVSELELLSLNQVEVSQSSGSLAWDYESQAADPFSYNESDTIGLRGRDSTSSDWLMLFFGKMFVAPERKYESNFCIDSFIAHDAWYDLEHTAFQLVQFVAEGYNKSHIILFRDSSGNRMTTGQQVKAVLDYAIANGVEISYVQADLDGMTVQPPSDEQTDLACSEALQKCLRWQPDYFTKFDYSEAGSVLRFYPADQESNIRLPLSDVLKSGGFSIQKKSDMTLRGVVINYEVENKITDGTTQSVQTDAAGETEGPNVLVHTVQVDGFYQIATELSITISTVFIPVDWVTNLTFVRSLFGSHICSIQNYINTPSYPTSKPYDFYISSGYQAGYGVVSYPMNFGWYCTWRTINNAFHDIIQCTDTGYPFGYTTVYGWKTCSLNLTSSAAGTYTRSGDPITVPGELIPTGVANAVFNARAWPIYDGNVTRQILSLGSIASPINNINILNGLAEYESMRAPVQQVTRNYFDERETIKFGHPEQAGISDYIDLLRANRSVNRPMRRTWRT